MPSDKNVHRSKDGMVYESYSEMAAANIRHRDKILKSKGLDTASFAALRKEPSKPKTGTKKKQPKRLARASAAPRRTSLRIRKSPPTNEGLVEILHEKHFETKSKRRKTAKQSVEVKPLTDKQREILKAARQDWLEDMELYLKEVDCVSHQNRRSVMRQVEKLVTGHGITYHHWKQGVYFYKNQRVSLSSDFDAMHEEACDFEDEHGIDLGNGWLLRHPITKLRNFQQYFLEKQQKNE